MNRVRMTVRNPDFPTARRIADFINGPYPGTAAALNPTIVAIRPPQGQDMVSFLTSVENLQGQPDEPAKVVIDEVAGGVVMGDTVRISTGPIPQGHLTSAAQETPKVTQP